MPGHTAPPATSINILEEAGTHDKAVCPHVVSPEARNVRTEIMLPQTCSPCACLKNGSMVPPRSSKSKPMAVLDPPLSPSGTSLKTPGILPSLDQLSPLCPHHHSPALATSRPTVHPSQAERLACGQPEESLQNARLVLSLPVKCVRWPLSSQDSAPALDLVLRGLAPPASPFVARRPAHRLPWVLSPPAVLCALAKRLLLNHSPNQTSSPGSAGRQGPSPIPMPPPAAKPVPGTEGYSRSVRRVKAQSAGLLVTRRGSVTSLPCEVKAWSSRAPST